MVAVQTKKIKYYGGEFHEESDLRNKKDKRTEKKGRRDRKTTDAVEKTTKLPEAARLTLHQRDEQTQSDGEMLT